MRGVLSCLFAGATRSAIGFLAIVHFTSAYTLVNCLQSILKWVSDDTELPLLTIREASALVGKSSNTLRRAIAKGSLKWVSNNPREGYRLTAQGLLEAGFEGTQVSTQTYEVSTQHSSEIVEQLRLEVASTREALETERVARALAEARETEALAQVASTREALSRLEGRLEERGIAYEGLLAIVSPLLTIEAESRVSGYPNEYQVSTQVLTPKSRRWWRR